jgi:hypothetical protein
MSPEQRASLADLARLRAEIASDRSAMGRALEDMGATSGSWAEGVPDRPHLALGALALHGWYGGLESILERTARALDGTVPSGDARHRALLSQAMVEIPSLRPAIVDRSLLPELLGLLEFRHFLRHAYGVELDPVKLRQNLERATSIAPEVTRLLERFDLFLEEAMRSVED